MIDDRQPELRAEEISQANRPPLLIIVDGQEWSARAFESVLTPHGYSVVRCRTGQQALELSQTLAPDGFLIKNGLPDIGASELSRRLRLLPHVGWTTPIIITSSALVRGRERLDAFSAGAWDVINVPIDAEELVLRLNVYVQARLEADRARQASLVDTHSGFYSVQGLLRIVRELTLDASRHNSPIACAVLGPEDERVGTKPDRESSQVAERFVQFMSQAGRGSDAIGRLGQTEFVVVAPRTDSSNVVTMAHRFRSAAENFTTSEPTAYPLRIRIGCYAVDNFQESPIEPTEILTRATLALRQAQRDPASPVYFFGQSYSST